MATSMTGFGAATGGTGGVSVRIELRSVNHKRLDVKFRPATGALAIENMLAERLRERIERGHVEAHVDVQAHGHVGSLLVDEARANAWSGAIQRIGAALQVSAAVDALQVSQLPGVVQFAPIAALIEANADAVTATFDAAVTELLAARQAEGARLIADLRSRVAEIQRLVTEIEAFAGAQLADRRADLHDRVAQAMQKVGAELDPGRLEQEILHLSDRVDVTEELVRLRSHLVAFDGALTDDQAPGRKLGFLGQELLRELNTIGSKSLHLGITERVIAGKVEVDKLREQVLNLE